MRTEPPSATSDPASERPAIGPIEIAPRTWWVGRVIPGDSFQCHSYLIEHGDQSVLIDPGSLITWPETRSQVEALVGLQNVKYFLCHHQDPDIAAALPEIDASVTRPDAAIVTHWRTETLLKHYALKNLPFWRVDEHDWQLDLGGRILRFTFTPYCHFAGAFATFDATTGTLFSSDIFGGFSDECPALYAQDESHFESLRPFHEHYMPSRAILGYTLSNLEVLPIRQIAPQHGAIIPERLVPYMIAKLKEIECGLYLLADSTNDMLRLSRRNAALREIGETLTLHRDFRDIAVRLGDIIGRFLPVESLEFYAALEWPEALALVSEHHYHGEKGAAPAALADILGARQDDWTARNASAFAHASWPLDAPQGEPALIVPLFSPTDRTAEGAAVIRLARPFDPTPDLKELIAHLSLPLQVAVEREMLLRSLELDRESIYERSIRDALTGLFTRLYMSERLKHLCALQDRGSTEPVGIIMFDLDRFKDINDRFGHLAGDRVLTAAAGVLARNSRAADVPVRFGGDEFALITVGGNVATNEVLAERIRAEIAALVVPEIAPPARITVSAGVAVRNFGEATPGFIGRADRALYRAKKTGRNRVRSAPQRDAVSGER